MLINFHTIYHFKDLTVTLVFISLSGPPSRDIQSSFLYLMV